MKILSSGTVLHTIKLPTGEVLNGYAFDGVKKTSRGFEISIEYGSVIYYHKAFVFICRQHKFYLSRIKVDSFNKHNPEKWSKKVIRVRANVPLEKFFITDFYARGCGQIAARSNNSLDRSGGSVFRNLIGTAKVNCKE